MAEVCERCGGPGRSGYRYCKECEAVVKADLKAQGYLEESPPPSNRPSYLGKMRGRKDGLPPRIAGEMEDRTEDD